MVGSEIRTTCSCCGKNVIILQGDYTTNYNRHNCNGIISCEGSYPKSVATMKKDDSFIKRKMNKKLPKWKRSISQ